MMDEPTVQIATPADAPSISDLLYEFNGEALPPAKLAGRMEQAQGLETVFLGELAGRLAGLLVLRVVPTLSEPEDWAEITELYVRPAARRKGVGKALTKKITELVETGKLEYYETLRESVPSALFEIASLSGLDRRKTGLLYLKLGVSTLSELERACLEDRVSTLRGFNKETQQKLLEELQQLKDET